MRQILPRLPYFSFQSVPGSEHTALSYENVTYGDGNDRQVRATYTEADIRCFNPIQDAAVLNHHFPLHQSTTRKKLLQLSVRHCTGSVMPSEPDNQDRRNSIDTPSKVVIGHPFHWPWRIGSARHVADRSIEARLRCDGHDHRGLGSIGVQQLLRNTGRARRSQVRIAPVPFLVRSLNAAALRGACFQRFARQIAARIRHSNKCLQPD